MREIDRKVFREPEEVVELDSFFPGQCFRNWRCNPYCAKGQGTQNTVRLDTIQEAKSFTVRKSYVTIDKGTQNATDLDKARGKGSLCRMLTVTDTAEVTMIKSKKSGKPTTVEDKRIIFCRQCSSHSHFRGCCNMICCAEAGRKIVCYTEEVVRDAFEI